MEKPFNRRVILFFLIAVIITTIIYFPINLFQNTEVPKPVDGVLDLRGWDFSKGRPSMTGNWEFCWNRLLTYQDFGQGTAPDMQNGFVPDTWDDYDTGGERLPGFGYATYRLKVKTDHPEQVFSLRMDTISTAYRLFINETEIAKAGTVGVDEQTSVPRYWPQVVDFTPPAEEFDIIVQVSNFTYSRGGIWYEVYFGTHEQIGALNNQIIYKDAFLIGCLVIMVLYYASFYFVLLRDKSSKNFTLLCLIFILRISLYGDSLICRIFPHMPFRLLVFLTYLTLYWTPVLIFLLVDSLYSSRFGQRLRRICLIYACLATLLTAILPIHIYTGLIRWIEGVGLIIAVLFVWIVGKAYLRREKGSGLILLAVLSMLFTGLRDVLYQAGLLYNSFGELAPVGTFYFTFTLAFIIASRFSDAFDQSRALSVQLAESLEKEKQSGKELMETELAFLKAQIKPHFIYNSLSVIAALTLEAPQQAKELLYNLTDYLRGSFDFDNHSGLVPLSEELETVKAYLAIQKARFADKLRAEFALEEGIEIHVPMLTLQPLVENAVRHGILYKPEGGRVVIRTFRLADSVVIQVEDEGVGIPKCKLDQMMAEKGSTSKGVGIRNINRRLMLFYGRELEIQSREGAGTIVTIRIPQEEGDSA